MLPFPPIPPHDPGLFVDRQDELSIILQKVDTLKQVHFDPKRAVIFEGDPKRAVIFEGGRGTGKSWLIRQFRYRLHQDNGVRLFFLDLKDVGHIEPLAALHQVLGRFYQEIIADGGPVKVPAEELGHAIEEKLDRLAVNQPVVLLLDTVYETQYPLLKNVEDFLLAPLARQPWALLVMAGRGAAYPWSRPELRNRKQIETLQPFANEIWTKQQLELQYALAVSKATMIHEITGGNPLANYYLAVSQTPELALDRVVEEMLSVAQPRVWRNLALLHYNEHLRRGVEAMCVLRSFDEYRMEQLLNTYPPSAAFRSWDFRACRELKIELVQNKLAEWKPDMNGNVMDEGTRSVAEAHLYLTRRADWKTLHGTALDLYETWSRQYPQAATRWKQEAEYHKQRLARLGHLP